jgi:hypothetical protein
MEGLSQVEKAAGQHATQRQYMLLAMSLQHHFQSHTSNCKALRSRSLSPKRVLESDHTQPLKSSFWDIASERSELQLSGIVVEGCCENRYGSKMQPIRGDCSRKDSKAQT